LEHIRHKDEQVGGEGVPLAEAVFAVNPVPQNPVEEDGSETRAKDIFHPAAPPAIEATDRQNGQEALPVHRVESLPEVNFEDNGWRLARMAAAEEVSRIDNIF
jgi:hypothetical protein